MITPTDRKLIKIVENLMAADPRMKWDGLTVIKAVAITSDVFNGVEYFVTTVIVGFFDDISGRELFSSVRTTLEDLGDTSEKRTPIVKCFDIQRLANLADILSI